MNRSGFPKFASATLRADSNAVARSAGRSTRDIPIRPPPEVGREIGESGNFQAPAGGGRIGKYRVDRPADLATAVGSGRNGAAASFGKPGLFIEQSRME